MIKHNLSQTREYRLWKNIKTRCYNKNRIEYKNYGGRGITLDPYFLDPINFVNYLINLNGYKQGLELDRIDNDKNYEPGNLKWPNRHEQACNRRNKK